MKITLELKIDNNDLDEAVPITKAQIIEGISRRFYFDFGISAGHINFSKLEINTEE